MPQKNTLFNYFVKSPSQTKLTGGKDLNKSPLVSNKNENVTASLPSKNNKAKTSNTVPNLCDVVWAKLDGYPWWPSLICHSPNTKNYTKGNNIHVQFFDDPPTRAWIKIKHTEFYKSSIDKAAPVEDRSRWLNACKQADAALQLAQSERIKLVVDFTNEQSDSENDQDLENIEKDEESVTASVQQKEGGPPAKRRRILVLDSEDSEDDYKPEKQELEAESENESSGVDSDELSEMEIGSEAEEHTPVKPKKRRTDTKVTSESKRKCNTNTPPNNCTPTRQVNENTKAKLSLFPAKEQGTTVDTNQHESKDAESWVHLKLDFLKPDKIRDAKRRQPSDPDYDPRTLYVPDDFKKNLTPAMKQWWEMKSQHFDCVLFFKVGKFYELYHMDAVVGVNELGLLLMKGDKAHSGFPEIAFGRFSASLIEKGYKVARVEQTETPEMMSDRCKNLGKVTKFDKVVKREICQISSKGTRVYSVIDGEMRDAESNYLLAFLERVGTDSSSYGVCFVDTSIGNFHIGQFDDDRHCTRLRTLLAHYPPAHILYERGAVSERTWQVLQSSQSNVLKEALAPGSEFWSAEQTLSKLTEGGYFSEVGWPNELNSLLSDSDSVARTAHQDSELSVRALGACVYYLRECHIDQQLLCMGQFCAYHPADVVPSSKASLGRYMVLDSMTLNNLGILNGPGSLLQRLDVCCSPFGKRLLRQWVCSPLCDTETIRSRQEAVSQLLQNPQLLQEARSSLGQLPDLERLLSKIHAQGNGLRSRTHPDSRAIFYEDNIYSKKRITDFVSTLTGFKTAEAIVKMFQDKADSVSSKLLVQCTHNPPFGKFPVILPSLEFFETAFDHEQAQKEGRIIPKPGVDEEYDAITEELQAIQKKLDSYLESQRKYFGCKVTYYGSDKKRFQLEVAESAAKKAGRDYELQSQRKGYKRFWTSETRDFLAASIAADTKKKNILKDLNRRIFAQFSSKQEEWAAVVQCLSVLDVIMSLAEYSRSEGGETVVPEFVSPSDDMVPHIKIVDGRHPSLPSTGFIPNDTKLGCDGAAGLLLLTGPNMGGKSTLMRQVGLITIMAHLGCAVPATQCILTPVDRVFTRLGAGDDILAGESTFLVELSETAAILHHATQHALVLVDELGRGTSTHDGAAIAAGVVRELAFRSCRAIFSTHYHALVAEAHALPVTLGHMACMVEREEEDDPSQDTVTFLYKLVDGACPKSYGFNAARLAGIHRDIIHNGHRKAVHLEMATVVRKVFRQVVGQQDITASELSKLVAQVALGSAN